MTAAANRFPSHPPAAPPPRAGRRLRRLVPLAVLAAGLATGLALDLHTWLGFTALARHRQMLLAFVAVHPATAPLAYIALYALVTALSLPGAALLTLAGGFLFGVIPGALYAVAGATAGAIAVFLAARTALGNGWRHRAGPWLARLEDGFRRDALSYLLVLRLVPLFPFWLVNLVPAVLGVPLRTYVLATAIGIVPGALVYASAGNGLGAVFESGGTPDPAILLTPELLLPILGLAALALVPVLYRKIKEKV